MPNRRPEIPTRWLGKRRPNGLAEEIGIVSLLGVINVRKTSVFPAF
jgi:hypothetical protein